MGNGANNILSVLVIVEHSSFVISFYSAPFHISYFTAEHQVSCDQSCFALQFHCVALLLRQYITRYRVMYRFFFRSMLHSSEGTVR